MRHLRTLVCAPCVALFLLAGCGEEPKTVEFKPTDTKQFEQMKNDMMKNMMGKGKSAPKPAPAPK